MVRNEQSANPDPHSESDHRCRNDAAGGRPNVNCGGVILRHIDDLRIRRLNYIHSLACRLLHLDRLLRIAAKRTSGIGLSPQSLNRLRHSSLISRERLSDGGVIVDVLRHHLQHLREIHQGDKCRIESLTLSRIGQRGARQTRVLLQPGIHIQDFLRICRGRSDLRQQRIWIKSDRSQQLIQFLRCRDRCLRRKKRTEVRQNYQRDQQQNRAELICLSHETHPDCLEQEQLGSAPRPFFSQHPPNRA